MSNDWVVRYDNRLLQVERQSWHPPARSTVLVRDAANGALEIRYRDHAMRWTEITADARVAQAQRAAVQAPAAAPRAAGASRRRHPGPDHPWRKQIRLDIANPGPPIWEVWDR